MLFLIYFLKVCIYILYLIFLGNVTKLFVSSGTISVNIDGTVQVLAEEALKVEDIDEAVFF